MALARDAVLPYNIFVNKHFVRFLYFVCIVEQGIQISMDSFAFVFVIEHFIEFVRENLRWTEDSRRQG